MRIVLIGQAAFGEKMLEKLISNEEKVVGVYMPPDSPGKPNTFKDLASGCGITVFQPKRMREPSVFEEYQKLDPELNVLAFVTDIIPERILHYPKFGSIQYHPSLLPKHRGGSSINWAVIKGEKKTGVSIFWPDKGIDTGPILLQKEVEIAPDDTVGSLYFNKLFPIGIDALIESIKLVKEGRALRIPQDDEQATYEGLCTEKDSVIDWSNPVGKVYNLIRGTNPQPGAITYFKGKRFKIFDSEKALSPSKAEPGEILEIKSTGFVVAAAGGAILVKRVQSDRGAKIPATDFIAQSGLMLGEKLGK